MGKIERRERSFAQIEAMPLELRQCVYEYGLPIVTACLKHGVDRPTAIHELVREIWEGARQMNQRRVSGGTLDWILVQAGIDLNVLTLKRLLHNNNLAILSLEPTASMIEASMATVSGGGQIMTKREKHKRRLQAALRAEGDKVVRSTRMEVAA